jgi:hypothetical protein
LDSDVREVDIVSFDFHVQEVSFFKKVLFVHLYKGLSEFSLQLLHLSFVELFILHQIISLFDKVDVNHSSSLGGLFKESSL